MSVEAWVCPTEGCGNYYGSSSQAGLDLGAEINLESDLSHTVDTNPARPKATGNRGICPDCRTAGRGDVQRVLVTLVVDLEAETAVQGRLARAVAAPQVA